MEPDEFYKLTEVEQGECLLDRAIYGQYVIKKEEGSVRRIPPEKFYEGQE